MGWNSIEGLGSWGFNSYCFVTEEDLTEECCTASEECDSSIVGSTQTPGVLQKILELSFVYWLFLFERRKRRRIIINIMDER